MVRAATSFGVFLGVGLTINQCTLFFIGVPVSLAENTFLLCVIFSDYKLCLVVSTCPASDVLLIVFLLLRIQTVVVKYTPPRFFGIICANSGGL